MSFHLFQAHGVECEYMIVDRATLDVRPIADRLLRSLAQANAEVVEEVEGWPSEVSLGAISASNELVMHVAELKLTEPAANLDDAGTQFQDAVRRVNRALEAEGCRLLGTAMHPWMDPAKDKVLWLHGHRDVYATFDRIFDCRGHGWANLQSVHLNLPFTGDEEFGRLHGAIRFLLPIMPSLTASSPVAEGRIGVIVDQRMEAYRTNSDRVPQVRGMLVPEGARTQAEYDAMVFHPLYKAIWPYDLSGVLQREWLNARGAIARFGRGTIEIRVLDVQEHPGVDVAVCALLSATLRAMVEGELGSLDGACAWDTRTLGGLIVECIADAERARVPREYALVLGVACQSPSMTAGDLWRSVLDSRGVRARLSAQHQQAIASLLDRGCLSRRIARALGVDFLPPSSEGRGGPGSGVPVPRDSLMRVYQELAICLEQGRAFEA
ncbi:MAG: glutamate-cysteine ligase family protein [Planctomycetota bacterium]|nr:glutamate-cysteine ligase family protein [Planctomycetota bacterium]